MLQNFSKSDILDLRDNPSEYVKLNIIGKIANSYGGSLLSEEEKDIANDILRLFAQDVSTRIRATISEKFCKSESIPYDVAKKLASDIEEMVAVPVIEYSALLSEDDLLGLLKQDSIAKQNAVAKRKNLPASVVDEIIDNSKEKTVQLLIDSNHQQISGQRSEKILEKFSQSELIIKELVNFNKIKLEDAHNLLSIVSEDLRRQIIFKYDIPTSVVNSLVYSTKDYITLNIIKAQIAEASDEKKLTELVSRLADENNLSITLLLKLLSLGYLQFFIHSLAQLASIPAANAQLLLEEVGDEGALKLFEKAKLPKNISIPTKILFLMVKQLADAQINSERIQSKAIQFLEETLNNGGNTSIKYILTIIHNN